MRGPEYVYLTADEPIKRVQYYYDHLGDAREAGHGSLADWIRALHAERGGVAAKVAEDMGVTYATVTRWFRLLCLPVRSRGGKLPMDHPRRREVAGLYARLGTGSAVAGELGVNPSTVYKWLREDGVPRTGKPGRKRKERRWTESTS